MPFQFPYTHTHTLLDHNVSSITPRVWRMEFSNGPLFLWVETAHLLIKGEIKNSINSFLLYILIKAPMLWVETAPSSNTWKMRKYQSAAVEGIMHHHLVGSRSKIKGPRDIRLKIQMQIEETDSAWKRITRIRDFNWE